MSQVSNKVSGISLSSVTANTGATVLYSYGDNLLTVSNPVDGVFEIKKTTQDWPCTIGSNGCEPDRYEIRLPGNLTVYGLGTQIGANQVSLDDLLDTNFGGGHILNSGIDYFDLDVGRMRTPVVVIPQLNMILAYLQPASKMIRLTRDGSYGCPLGQTCIVFKKNNRYPDAPQAKPAEMVVIRGNNLADAYGKYYQYLNTKGFYFRKPDFRTFGVNWESSDEMNCLATQPHPTGYLPIQNVVNNYESQGITFSSVTAGSGYWATPNAPGCGGATDNGLPATDSLTVNSSFGGNTVGMDNNFNSWLSQRGIVPIIGMRSEIELGNNNPAVVQQKFQNKGISSPFLPSGSNDLTAISYYQAPPPVPPATAFPRVKLIDTTSPSVVSAWINILHDSYGQFGGIKEDDMMVDGQQRIDSSVPNLFSNRTSLSYKLYYDYHRGNFLIFGRNDWISAADDAEALGGWLGNAPLGFTDTKYVLKYYLDEALTLVMSGYPHPRTGFYYSPRFGSAGTTVPDTRQKEFLRGVQLATFWPVTNISRVFGHVNDPNYQSAQIFSARLRVRLQQYMFDMAMKWYETGVPWEMQPLLFRWPNDATANQLYGRFTDENYFADEYMFGNALLVRPLFSDFNTDISPTSTVYPVYLPSGKWRPFLHAGLSDAVLNSGTGGVLNYNVLTDSGNVNDFPVFLKNNEILVIGDSANPASLWVNVYLDQNGDTTNPNSNYTLHNKDGSVRAVLTAIKTTNPTACNPTGSAVPVVSVTNNTNGKCVVAQPDPFGKGYSAAVIDSII